MEKKTNDEVLIDLHKINISWAEYYRQARKLVVIKTDLDRDQADLNAAIKAIREDDKGC